MKRNYRSGLSILLAAFLLLQLLPFSAFAKELASLRESAQTEEGAVEGRCTVRFADEDGNELALREVEPGKPLGELPEGVWMDGEEEVSADTVVMTDLDLVLVSEEHTTAGEEDSAAGAEETLPGKEPASSADSAASAPLSRVLYDNGEQNAVSVTVIGAASDAEASIDELSADRTEAYRESLGFLTETCGAELCAVWALQLNVRPAVPEDGFTVTVGTESLRALWEDGAGGKAKDWLLYAFDENGTPAALEYRVSEELPAVSFLLGAPASLVMLRLVPAPALPEAPEETETEAVPAEPETPDAEPPAEERNKETIPAESRIGLQVGGLADGETVTLREWGEEERASLLPLLEAEYSGRMASALLAVELRLDGEAPSQLKTVTLRAPELERLSPEARLYRVRENGTLEYMDFSRCEGQPDAVCFTAYYFTAFVLAEPLSMDKLPTVQRSIRAQAEDGARVEISGLLPERAVARICPIQLTQAQQAALGRTTDGASRCVAYDVSILVGGEVWEPQDGQFISVSITPPDWRFDVNARTELYHIDESSGDASADRVDISLSDGNAVSFEAGSFSPFVFCGLSFLADWLIPTAYAEDADSVTAVIPVAGSGSFTLFRALGTTPETYESVSRMTVNGTAEFTQSFTRPGSYRYRLEGRNSYQSVAYDVTVSVQVAGGVLQTPLVTIYEEGSSTKVSRGELFYTTVSPVLRKSVTGPEPSPKETYVFTFAEGGMEMPSGVSAPAVQPMPEGAVADAESGQRVKTLSFAGAGQLTAGGIVFTEPGTYRYRVKEQAGTTSNCLYDESEYELVYTVTKTANGMTAAQTITADGQSADELLFTNRYFQASYEPTARKAAVGSVPSAQDAEEYSFRFRGVSMTRLGGLLPLPGSIPMPIGSIGSEKTITITGPGEVKAGEIAFTEPGVYVYEWTEIPGSAENCRYDGSSYQLELRVERASGADGLRVTPTLKKDNRAVQEALFTNTYLAPAEASLAFKKTVVGSGIPSDPAETYRFTFEAVSTSVASLTGKLPMPGDAEAQSVELSRTGAGDVQLGTIRFALPGTYVYRLRENVPTNEADTNCIYDRTEYTVTFTVSMGAADAERLLVSTEISGGAETGTVEFVNRYLTAAVEPMAKKTVSGAKSAEAESYTFVFSTADPLAPMPEGAAADTETGRRSAQLVIADVTGAGDYSVSAGELVFTRPGVYVYEWSELPGSAPNGIYDASRFRVTYTVTNTGDAAGLTVVPSVCLLSGSGAEETATAVGETAFTNRYLSVTDAPLVSKSIVGEEPVGSETFTFLLESSGKYDSDGTPLGGAIPMPEGADGQKKTVTCLGQGSAEIGEICFTEPGVYEYKLTEVPPEDAANSNCSYDAGEYCIRYTVTRESDPEEHLSLVRTVTRDGESAGEMTFTNRYQPPVTATPEIRKSVSGRTPLTPESYRFVFRAVSMTDALGTELTGALPMPGGIAEQRLTLEKTGPGSVDVEAIRFTVPGTYVYEVTESAGENASCRYDDTVYRLVCEVTKTADGLTASFTATKDGAAAEIDFNNYYYPPAVVNFPIENTVIGPAPTPEENYRFVFEALRSDVTGMTALPMPGGAAEQSIELTIEGEGRVNVGEITFSEPGTYAYRITETAGTDRSCDYDGSVFVLTYRVEKGSDGTLTVQRSLEKDGSAVDAALALFVNRRYGPVKVDPPVGKRIQGEKPAAAETYTFVFRAVSTTVPGLEGAMPMPDGADGQSMTLHITGEGEVEAGEFELCEPGQYVYEYTEKAGSNPNCSYDTSVYRILFEVKKGTDALTAEKTVTKDGVPVTGDAVFTNTYKPPVSPDESPKTGDENNAALWIMVGVGSLAAAGLAVFALARTKKSARRAGTREKGQEEGTET